MTKTMGFSVIIPTYNRADLVSKTLQSFVEINYPRELFEIIIVNNNSTDNTEQVVKEFIINSRAANLLYLFESRQGVHYARNSGAKISKFEILYFTDDDMIADPELLNEIIKPFQFDIKVAAVTGKVLPIWEVLPPKWILKHCNNFLLSLLNPEYDFMVANSIGYLYSCHQAVNRDAFFKAEGFNPEYTKGKYMGDGETGLNTKIKDLGFKFGFNGKSVIYHMIPKARLTQSYLNKRMENNGRAHAYSKYRRKGSILYCLRSLFKNTLMEFPRITFSKILLTILKGDTGHLRLLLASYYYLYGNSSFFIQLVFNSKFKKFVIKYDWLSNDQELDGLVI